MPKWMTICLLERRFLTQYPLKMLFLRCFKTSKRLTSQECNLIWTLALFLRNLQLENHTSHLTQMGATTNELKCKKASLKRAHLLSKELDISSMIESSNLKKKEGKLQRLKENTKEVSKNEQKGLRKEFKEARATPQIKRQLSPNRIHLHLAKAT